MEIKSGETHTQISIQHLEYGSIIGGAWLNPYSVLKLFEAGRAVTTDFKSNLCKKAGIPPDDIFFLAWQQIEYLPSFYDRKPGAEQPITYLEYVNRKLKLYSFSKPIGSSSQPLEEILVDAETMKPLVHASVMIVNVDPKTRRPAPYNSFLKEYYTPEKCIIPIKIDRLLPAQCRKMYEIPRSAKTFSRITSISARQIDKNGHVNQAAYNDICFDCLGDAFAKLFFGDFGSIFNHHLRRTSFLYLKECRILDLVKTTVWQDGENLLAFKFHVLRQDDLLCQVEIEFFPRKANLKSLL